MDNDSIVWILGGVRLILTPNLVKRILEHFNFAVIEARDAINISPSGTTYEIRFSNPGVEKSVFKFVWSQQEFLEKNGYSPDVPKMILSYVCGSGLKHLNRSVITDCDKSDVTISIFDKQEEMSKMFEIRKVVFNDPATIVYWQDGTKTVVKCQKNDTFEKEKGLAMCFVKKLLGNKGNYYETIKKWTEDPVKKEQEPKKESKPKKMPKSKENPSVTIFIKSHYRRFGGDLSIREIAYKLGMSYGKIHRLITNIIESEEER
jgi:hypothetical protein